MLYQGANNPGVVADEGLCCMRSATLVSVRRVGSPEHAPADACSGREGIACWCTQKVDPYKYRDWIVPIFIGVHHSVLHVFNPVLIAAQSPSLADAAVAVHFDSLPHGGATRPLTP